ncbi:hypothetical protein, partial [Leucobacter chironomi]|uniref:hypothetical protein n=1 Tax=Leucobacter chironomi TaxID=491918 RepID=UPI0005601BCF
YIIDASFGQARTVHEQRDGPTPGPSAAAHLLTRARQRARSATATALALYGLRPWQLIEVIAGDQPASATVESVTWEYPATRMRVTLSDITTHP